MLPKLRAWCKRHEEMLRVVSINFDEEFIRGLSVVESNLDIESSYNFDEIELLQSSGLKDYHKDEYFSGDVARGVISEELGVIEYIDGSFVIAFKSGIRKNLNEVKDDFGIIGNKFEHPHLIEGIEAVK